MDGLTTVKKHMSPEEFTAKLFSRLESKIKSGLGNGCDSIIMMIYLKHTNDIAEHLQAILSGNEDLPETFNVVAYNFHKGFRSYDPINDKYTMINSIMWRAIAGSDEFWECMKYICTGYDTGMVPVGDAE